MSTVQVKVCLFSLLSIHIVDVLAAYEGDECTLENGEKGVCKMIHSCPIARALLLQNDQPEICGFTGHDPIVCCSSGKLKLATKVCLEYGNAAEPISTVAYVVAGGHETKQYEIPHMAALGYGDRNNVIYKCGGSLISKKFVLTAAHCVYSRTLGPVRWVRLGAHNLTNPQDNDSVQDFTVASTHIHPSYEAPIHYHDVALLELDREVLINNEVKPACLYARRKLPDKALAVTGWGATHHAGVQSSVLLEAEIHHVDSDDCKAAFRPTRRNERTLPDGIIDDYQICAGSTLGIDTCEGDSGGPLQVFDYETSTFDIIGITSFGKACAITKSPGVYTRVSNYIEWIQTIVETVDNKVATLSYYFFFG